MKDYPLASLFILAYKQSDFIQEALDGAVTQDYPNLEIIVSDDCSPDNTFDIIKSFAEKYRGPHKLIINQNSKNLGIVGHFNHVIKNLCHGDFLLPTGGDDVCLPSRVSVSVKSIIECKADALSLNMIIINDKSEKTAMMQEVSDKIISYSMDDYIKGQYISSGASRIIKRDLIDSFGYLDDDCPTEDSTMLFRAFMKSKVAFCHIPGVRYRVHGNNISIGINQFTLKTDLITKQYYKDLDLALDKNYVNILQYNLLKSKINFYAKMRRLEEEKVEAIGAFEKSFIALKLLFIRVHRRIKFYHYL